MDPNVVGFLALARHLLGPSEVLDRLTRELCVTGEALDDFRDRHGAALAAVSAEHAGRMRLVEHASQPALGLSDLKLVEAEVSWATASGRAELAAQMLKSAVLRSDATMAAFLGSLARAPEAISESAVPLHCDYCERMRSTVVQLARRCVCLLCVGDARLLLRDGRRETVASCSACDRRDVIAVVLSNGFLCESCVEDARGLLPRI